jgi:hypothetical protein
VLDSARRTVIVSQVIFFVPLGFCVAWIHTGAVNRDGISYYGVHQPTLEIIAVSYLGAEVLLWRAARELAESGQPRELGQGLRVVALGLPGLLLTPYPAGPVWNWSHMVIGVVSGLVEFGLAIDLVLRDPTLGTWVTGGVQLAGGLLAAASLPDWNFPYLLVGEVIFELGFAGTMFRWLRPERARSSEVAA